MQFLRTLQDRSRALIMPMIATLCLAYLGYHTIQGDRGLRAWVSLRTQLVDVKYQQAEIKAKHDWLVHKASLLRRGKVDPDMLDEALRRHLHLGRKGEIVIRYRKPLPIN